MSSAFRRSPRDHNFFEIGGNSLAAAGLLRRSTRRWAYPFRSRCSSTARRSRGSRCWSASETHHPNRRPVKASATIGWTPLVPIRKGGSRRPFFCVHGAGGNLLNFRDFVQRLDAEQPVYGLEARGVDGQLPPAGVDRGDGGVVSRSYPWRAEAMDRMSWAATRAAEWSRWRSREDWPRPGSGRRMWCCWIRFTRPPWRAAWSGASVWMV